MSRIFENCKLWEKELCDYTDLVNLHRRRHNEEKPLKKPDDKEHFRIDEVCAKCNFPLDVTRIECPVCGNENLHKEIVKIQDRFNHIQDFRCDVCGRILIFSAWFNRKYEEQNMRKIPRPVEGC